MSNHLNGMVSCDWLAASSIYEALPKHLAVGWSGGVDSTALLLALKHYGFEVQAWHIDHAWHQDSAAETEQLREQAEAWDIPFYSQRLPVLDGKNREAQARQGRYRAFAKLSEQTGEENVALGHHADDQAETVCMRMLQGAGVAGAQGMRASTQMYGLSLYRPLLHVRRNTLKQALCESAVPWLEDVSNTDVTLWRNKIRHGLFPAMNAVGVDAHQLWLRWQKQAVRLTQDIELVANGVEIVDTVSPRGCRVDWKAWICLPLPMRVHVLQQMQARVFGSGSVMGRRHLLLVEQWRQKGARGGLDLSKSRLYRQEEGLHLQMRAASSHF